MCISSRPRTGIRVDGQPIKLVDEFCYLGCTLKNNGSYERDVQQRCAKATSAFNSLTKCLWSTLITNEVKLRVYLSAIRPIMMYGSEIWAAPSTVMERLDESCLDGYVATFGLGRPADRLVQRVLKSSSGSSWKKPPGRKRKFWTEAVKEDLRTLGVDRQIRRDARFRRTWNSDEWIDWQKIEKVWQSCVQGRHTSAKMRVIASGDDISPPIKSKSCEVYKRVTGLYNDLRWLADVSSQCFDFVLIVSSVESCHTGRVADHSILHVANQTQEVVNDDKKSAVPLDVSQFKPEEPKVHIDGRDLTIEGRQEEKSEC
ncbi:hypothetical protein RB195_022343 [Necator americanus]|uniref:SHSP domain-containing protein n=1 Tax=Necator americanus TaxID=51031 RepID=A0ABR1EF84_NECAM